MTELSNVDQAIEAAKYVVACYNGMISGFSSGKPFTDSQLIAYEMTQEHVKKLFDALDQVATELVTLDDGDEYNDEGDVDLTATYVGYDVLAPEEATTLYAGDPVTFVALDGKQVGKTAATSKWEELYPPKFPQTEYIFGTAIAPSTFLPMDPPVAYADQVATGLSYAALRKALEDLWKPGWEKPHLQSLTTSYTPYESTATFSLLGYGIISLDPNTLLNVDGEQYLITNMSQELAGNYGQLTVTVVKLHQEMAKATVAVNGLVDTFKHGQAPWYAKYNQWKGKKK